MTRPPATVATFVALDDHAAAVVTVCADPSLSCATACSCVLWPIWIDVLPVIDSPTTVGAPGVFADTVTVVLADRPLYDA